jgi:hypothetical protein
MRMNTLHYHTPSSSSAFQPQPSRNGMRSSEAEAFVVDFFKKCANLSVRKIYFFDNVIFSITLDLSLSTL